MSNVLFDNFDRPFRFFFFFFSPKLLSDLNKGLNLSFFFRQDYDLCISCKDKDGHGHPMKRLGLDLDDGSSPVDAKQANPQVNISRKHFLMEN